jgi:hypothetical protein
MEKNIDSEFWKDEVNKIQDPISGPYYFYLNYLNIYDSHGNVIPKLSEKEFNKQYKNIQEIKTVKRRR